MKNKALTYTLIIIVALVWGLIIYRVVKAAGKDDDLPVVSSPVAEKIKPDNYDLQVDTTHLMLNYPDPFVKQEVASAHGDVTIKPIKTVISPLVHVKIPVNWDFVTYNGFIKNARSKKTLTILSVRGRQYTLSDGESADNVKLMKNMTDSVRIIYQGQSKNIVMYKK